MYMCIIFEMYIHIYIYIIKILLSIYVDTWSSAVKFWCVQHGRCKKKDVCNKLGKVLSAPRIPRPREPIQGTTFRILDQCYGSYIFFGIWDSL